MHNKLANSYVSASHTAKPSHSVIFTSIETVGVFTSFSRTRFSIIHRNLDPSTDPSTSFYETRSLKDTH
jgi:hypothetical protein